jgi:hypothetical protein
MEKDRVQRYVESLERTIKNDYLYLKETIEDFRELCQMITPERSLPHGIVVDIRETYKEIRNRLTEIKAIEQLLQGKYRQYYHRNALQDKEILETGFVAKNCFTKFEYTLKQKEALEKIKEREKERALKGEQKGLPFQWFHSKEHQVMFFRNIRILGDLDYEIPSELKIEERREVAQEPRHLTLFVFKGDAGSLDRLYSQLRLREHDIMERYASDEIHGVLTHLREINSLTVEKLFLTFLEEFSSLKCLILPIHSSKELEDDVLGLVKAKLQEIAEGEVKTVSIEKPPSV